MASSSVFSGFLIYMAAAMLFTSGKPSGAFVFATFFGEWGEALPNKLLAASTLGRLRHGAYRLVLDGKSYRAPWPVQNDLKAQLEKESKTAK